MITRSFKSIQNHKMMTESLISPASATSLNEGMMFFVNENESYSDDQEYLWQPTNVNSKPTILEKALEYREENPNEWKNRQIEIERDLLESRQHFEEDSFLDQYYMKLDKDNQVRKGLINLIHNEPPSLQVQMKCEFTAKQRHTKKDFPDNFKENVEKDQITVFEKKRDRQVHTNAARRRIEALDKVQFHIRLSKGRNLSNALASDVPRLLECQVRCKLHAGDSKNTVHTWKSDYEFCDVRGVSKWNHVFAIKGYTSMELSRSFVTLEVVAKNQSGKLVIGETLLAGKNALIKDEETGITRLPTENENRYWQEAFHRPGKIVSVASKLDHRLKNGFGEALTALLNEEVSNGSVQRLNIIGLNGLKS